MNFAPQNQAKSSEEIFVKKLKFWIYCFCHQYKRLKDITHTSMAFRQVCLGKINTEKAQEASREVVIAVWLNVF